MQLPDVKLKYHFFIPFSKNKRSPLFVLSVFLLSQLTAAAAAEQAVFSSHVSLENKVNTNLLKEDFPPEFYELLTSGVEVPFLIRTTTGAEEAGKAFLRHTGDFLTIDRLSFSYSKITPEYKKLFEEKYGKPINYAQCGDAYPEPPSVLSDEEITALLRNSPSSALSLCFDVMKFELMGDLPEGAYLKEARARTKILPESTEKTLSGVLNYNASLVQLNHQSPDIYFHAKSLSSYGVNYLTLDGDLRSNDASQLYEARITRDFEGMNISAGYLGLWGMNDLGALSYTSAGRFIGVTAGNKGRSVQNDSSLSKTPIYVFMPASGQVSIYRDGKLINVQQLALGNQEVDTRPLPSGNYPVRAEVIVNGKVVSAKEEMIYKTASSLSGAEQQYQFFGGSYKEDNGVRSTYLAGASGQLVTRWLDLGASLYSYGSVVAFEPVFQKNFSFGSINGQLGMASDGGRNATLRANVNSGPVNVWGSYDYAKQGQEKGAIYDRKLISLGGTVDLQNIFKFDRSSQITASISEDRVTNNRSSRLDFSQSIYTNRWLDARITVGKYWQSQPGQDKAAPGLGSGFMGSTSSSRQSYYVGLNLNFSFGSGGVDYSRSLETETTGVSAAWTPKDIDGLDYLGVTASRSRSLVDSDVDATLNLGMRANGSNQILTWDGAVSNNNASGGVDITASLSGSLGWNKGGIGLANSQSDAGVIIKVDDEARGKLDLIVDGWGNLLENSSSFVPVSAFSQSSMTVRSSAKSPENYEIQQAEKDFVLYPGNVGLLEPKLKRLVTVFGVLVENGQPKPGVVLRNHIGSATTDEDGAFSVDVDSANPSVSYEVAKNKSCQIDFDLSMAQGALWVDEVACMPLKMEAFKS